MHQVARCPCPQMSRPPLRPTESCDAGRVERRSGDTVTTPYNRPVKTAGQAALYRKLPSVDELLRRTELAALAEREGHALVADSARLAVEALRQEIARHWGPYFTEYGYAV